MGSLGTHGIRSHEKRGFQAVVVSTHVGYEMSCQTNCDAEASRPGYLHMDIMPMCGETALRET